MDVYTATELAYKHGYEKGYEAGKRDATEFRCPDCIHWDKATVNKQGFLICPASGMKIMATDFCSCGERR